MTRICQAVCLAAALAFPAPAPAQTVRNTPQGPAIDTGIAGRWFLVIRTEDGLAPEVGPFPQKSDCVRATDGVVENVRLEHGVAMARKARSRARCEFR